MKVIIVYHNFKGMTESVTIPIESGMLYHGFSVAISKVIDITARGWGIDTVSIEDFSGVVLDCNLDSDHYGLEQVEEHNCWENLMPTDGIEVEYTEVGMEQECYCEICNKTYFEEYTLSSIVDEDRSEVKTFDIKEVEVK